MSLNDEQPAPLDGNAPATWDLVIADNGRDHLVDAYQEALDLAVYLRAEIEKRKKRQQPGP